MITICHERNASNTCISVNMAKQRYCLLEFMLYFTKDCVSDISAYLILSQMMKHAWDSYEKYAWGSNELRPISRRGHSASIFGASSLGATIIDALDTLYIMELDDEFKKGRDWVATSFKFEGVSGEGVLV